MAVSEERHVKVVCGGLPDLDAALSWAVQILDREFSGDSMVKVEIEQVMVSDFDDRDEQWRAEWVASVSGTTEPTEGAT